VASSTEHTIGLKKLFARSIPLAAVILGFSHSAGAASPPGGITLTDRCEIDPGNPSSPPGGWDQHRKTGRVILTMHGAAPVGARLRIIGPEAAALLVPFASGSDTPAIGYPAKITLLGASGTPLPLRVNARRYRPARGYHLRLAFTVFEMNSAKCRSLIVPPDQRSPPVNPHTRVRADMRHYYGVDEFGHPMVE
jgi:hypothetical protein